ncbi:unnamed protein product, partial [Rotaria sp. Silwood2]
MHHIFSWLFFILNILNVLSQSNIIITTTTTTPLSPLQSSNDKPFITQFLVFSSNTETSIRFEPKHGWL